MPRSSRYRLQLSDKEKKYRRLEQKKSSMRRARAKMDATALEEKRRKYRERYKKKREDGLIKTIRDYTPREQRQIRKIWRKKSQVKRDIENMNRRIQEHMTNNTPQSSPGSSHSRISAGRAVSARNRRQLKMKNVDLTRRLVKYRMRVSRLQLIKKKQPVADTTNKILSTAASTHSTVVQSVPGSPPCRILSPVSCQSFPSRTSASTPSTATLDASTVTGPSTPPTPDSIINIQSLALKKRLNFDPIFIDSDNIFIDGMDDIFIDGNSTSFSLPKKCKTRLTNFIC